MKNVGVLNILAAVTFGFAQAPDTLWTKTYGGAEDDVGISIQQTADGGFIITGYTESFGAGQRDVWLLRTDANGDTVWTNTFGGTGDDRTTRGRYTSDGGCIIVANITPSGAIYDDIWVIKTDSLGDTIWTKTYGDFDELEEGHDIQETRDNCYIMTGMWVGYGLGVSGIMLYKIDANGDSVWCRTYDPILPAGSRGYSVCETFDGGFTVAGAGGFIGWPIDVIMNTDEDGNANWVVENCSYSPTSCFRCVEQTADSGYIACGWGWDPSTLLITKVSSQGDTVWTREYGDNAFGMSGNSVLITDDNCYIITGTCWTNACDLFLLKVDENGDSLWCAIYGEYGYANDIGNEVLQTNDGCYIVAGYTESFGAANGDLWLLKFAPDVDVEENTEVVVKMQNCTSSIFSGPLQLHKGKKCRVFDIAGRIVEPDKITRGVYFIEVDGVITQKVVKIR